MSESEETKYRVVLFQGPAPPDDLGEMTETELYGYLRSRTGLGGSEAEAVLSELGQKGSATVHFDGPLGLKSRLEIRRSESK